MLITVINVYVIDIIYSDYISQNIDCFMMGKLLCIVSVITHNIIIFCRHSVKYSSLYDLSSFYIAGHIELIEFQYYIS